MKATGLMVSDWQLRSPRPANGRHGLSTQAQVRRSDPIRFGSPPLPCRPRAGASVGAGAQARRAKFYAIVRYSKGQI